MAQEPNSQVSPDTSGWDPDAALNSLVSEELVYGEANEREAAGRIFTEALPMAAKAITHLARFSKNEQLRFKAATYVVERNIGKISELGDLTGNAQNRDPLEALLGDVVKDVEKYVQDKSAEKAAKKSTDS